MPRHGKPIYAVAVNGRTRWVVYVSLTRGVRKAFATYRVQDITEDQVEELVRVLAKSNCQDLWIGVSRGVGLTS